MRFEKHKHAEGRIADRLSISYLTPLSIEAYGTSHCFMRDVILESVQFFCDDENPSMRERRTAAKSRILRKGTGEKVRCSSSKKSDQEKLIEMQIQNGIRNTVLSRETSFETVSCRVRRS